MEEIIQLRLEVEELTRVIQCVQDSRVGHVGGFDPRISQLSETIKIQKDIIAQTDEEIVRLKELIEKIRVGNGLELKNVVIGAWLCLQCLSTCLSR